LASKNPHIKELDFITLYFYEEYVISMIHEGVFFDLPHLEEVTKHFKAFYPEDKPFASIADRKNDYTINPTCFFQSDIMSNLVCIGTVCHSQTSYDTASFEKMFYKGNFEVFMSMKRCKRWVEKRIIKHKEKAGL
tara:strand:+ start:29147 stop:29551 length:405 start_codon:yes stop_codon:yes gene_type:complete